MANEITVTGSLKAKKNALNASLSGSATHDVSAKHYIQRVDTIAASEESVSKGDIATLGWVCFKNVGDTGIIQIGGATGAYTIKLNPGECSGPIKWSTNAIYAVGDVAGCLLEMLLISV